MSKYDLDLDDPIVIMDLSEEELNEIIAEADGIIAENSTNPEKLTVAHLKKAQCLYKLAQTNNNVSSDKEKLYKDKELLKKFLELKADMPEALMRLGTKYCYIFDYKEHFMEEKEWEKFKYQFGKILSKYNLSIEDHVKIENKIAALHLSNTSLSSEEQKLLAFEFLRLL